jgi:hypothetical protein
LERLRNGVSRKAFPNGVWERDEKNCDPQRRNGRSFEKDFRSRIQLLTVSRRTSAVFVGVPALAGLGCPW